MAASPRDKFEAAVKVIESLPKDGKVCCNISSPLFYYVLIMKKMFTCLAELQLWQQRNKKKHTHQA